MSNPLSLEDNEAVRIQEKMQFNYLGAPQRSPEWFEARLGKVTASRLEDWTAVSKRDGKPLKARLDYEKELMFERQFGRSFSVFTSEAMQDGIDFEDFARRQYEKISGLKADECGCWYSDHFVASPDAAVGEDGLLEIKILRDNSFSEVLDKGVPQKHWKQIQGQLWASGRPWSDYVAVNLNTKKMKIERVFPDEAFHTLLESSVIAPLSVAPFDMAQVYDIMDPLPNGYDPLAHGGALLDRSDNNLNTGDWAA